MLILDEPTSCLDSYATENVMEALNSLVIRENIALVLTIHQPSSRIFKMIHVLVFLKDGVLKFWGKTEQISMIFSKQNQIQKIDYNSAGQRLEILSGDGIVEKYEGLCLPR